MDAASQYNIFTQFTQDPSLECCPSQEDCQKVEEATKPAASEKLPPQRGVSFMQGDVSEERNFQSLSKNRPQKARTVSPAFSPSPVPELPVLCLTPTLVTSSPAPAPAPVLIMPANYNAKFSSAMTSTASRLPPPPTPPPTAFLAPTSTSSWMSKPRNKKTIKSLRYHASTILKRGSMRLPSAFSMPSLSTPWPRSTPLPTPTPSMMSLPRTPQIS